MDLEKALNKVRDHTPGIQDSRVECAVLVAFNHVEGKGWEVLYETRAMHIEHQPGEVCFPGGHIEPGESALECALRETEEELGIDRKYIDVLCELDTFHPVPELVMRPFLAVLKEGALDSIVPCPDEVHDWFTVPLEKLLPEPESYRFHAERILGEGFPFDELGITPEYKWRKIEEEIVIYNHKGHVVWGFTALITRAALRLLEKLSEGE